MKNQTRRDFIKNIAFISAAIPWATLLESTHLTFAKEQGDSPLPPGQNAVSTTDPVASAIGYQASIKNIDYSRYPQRKKPEAKNQFCKSCALYSSVNNSWGKCQMLTTGLVSAHGWCGSWNKK